MTTQQKVLFIGLDAADPELITQGCDEGWLPVLQGLRNKGVWAKVKTQRGFGDGATWPSLFTGVNPGRHGRYFYSQIKPGTYESKQFLPDEDFGHKPFWEYLSQAGRRVVVIDVVKAPLSKGINGIQIVDWLVHSQEGSPRSSPVHLASEVIANYGPDPFNGTTDIYKHRSAEEFRSFRDTMIDRVQTKTSLCERYLKHDSWDLFMVTYGDSHDIGHQCWHLHDPAHALYDSGWVKRYGNPVKDVYIALDSAIGKLLNCIEPRTRTVVFVGPGMEPAYTANHMLDKVLRRLDGRPDHDRNIVPHAIVSCLRPTLFQRLGNRINHAKSMYSMSRRKCFAVLHNENAGGVRINVAGREPAGCVKPGKDYEEVCSSITRDLLDLVNVDTGKPVVKEVVRVSDECHGKRLVALPDLLVVWSRDAPIGGVTSSKIGVVSESHVSGARTGDHNSDCSLYMQGPHIMQHGLIDPIAVEDIAPTITSMLDFTLPDCDGAPISSCLSN
jgi:predicted AlkP superfamily phosphohydrolase/phosphomutase